MREHGITGGQDHMTKENGSAGHINHKERERHTVSAHAGSCLPRAHKEMLQLPVIAVSVSTVVGATLIYSATGAMGIDDTLVPAQRVILGGLSAVMCWPLFHSMIATILYLARRLQPYQILTIWAASILFLAIPCAAVGYAIIGLFGLNDVPLLKIYLNFGVGLAACSTVLLYMACLRAKLRHTAESAFSEAHAVPEGSASADTRETPYRPEKPGAPGELGGPGWTAPETHVPAIKAAEGSVPEDGRSEGNPSPTETAAVSSAASRDGDTGEERPTAGSHGATEQPPKFLERLPPKLGRDVIYLNVSGHYVNAVTTEGAGVILMRFADAVAELGDVGIQVHRSYWVAHRHITGIFRRDERTMVRVTGGHELPVSRTHLSAVSAFIPQVARGSISDRQGS